MKKKKRKLKIKNFIILLVVFGLLIYGGITYMNIKSDESANPSNYSDQAISSASSYDIDNLDDYDYSKTLEEMFTNDLYLNEYFEEYLLIEYLDNDSFLTDVNDYLKTGYSGSEINNIFLLSNLNQEKLKALDYTDFTKYLSITNYNADNTKRYEEYILENTDLDLQTVVTYVNINLDLEFYEINEEVDDPSSTYVLVNKFNSLGDYVPENLVALENFSTIYMIEEAGEAFTNMLEAASTDGYTFEPTSAYRDYTWQSNLYTYYVGIDGEDIANTYSAKPGNSEHQSGLAVDIKNPTYHSQTGVRLNDEDYAWVLKNSYKYGYIVRYPADSTDITGYMEEPWHLRYLGVELATKVYESGLTYDEYYDLYISEY